MLPGTVFGLQSCWAATYSLTVAGIVLAPAAPEPLPVIGFASKLNGSSNILAKFGRSILLDTINTGQMRLGKTGPHSRLWRLQAPS